MVKNHHIPFQENMVFLVVYCGHGGGDASMIKTLYDIVNGSAPANTSLENSLESHLMAIAAEESRLQDGEVIRR